MSNRNLTTISLYFLLSALWSCKEQAPPANEITKFKVVDIHIIENGVKNIQNCANWYLDFSQIKKTVVYNEKIICVGSNGGFACLNSSDLQQDTVFENKLNTDFFTNASVYQDTLFAEKFDKIFFWNSNVWEEYLHPLPIRYFDLLFEDKSYAFYSSCMGEFGSILFVYNKTTGKTKAEFTRCPNSVVKTDTGYFVGTHLYHMAGSSDSYIIRDVEKLKVVPDSIRNMETRFDIDPRLAFIQDTSLEAKNNHIPFEFSYPREMIDTISNTYAHPEWMMIIASFNSNGKMYHIIDTRNFEKRDQRIIGTVINDTLKIIDTLENCTAQTVFQFGNTTIINKRFYEDGLAMVRNDTIFNITFNALHLNYKGPVIESYNLTTDSSKKPVINIACKYNLNDENYWTPKPGQAYWEFFFKLNNKYQFASYEGNNQDATYIYIDKKKTDLKLNYFIDRIFMYDNRLFLVFWRIGLIEITDIEKFARAYKE